MPKGSTANLISFPNSKSRATFSHAYAGIRTHAVDRESVQSVGKGFKGELLNENEGQHENMDTT